MPIDAEKIHRETLVADLHCDTVLQMKRGYDIAQLHDTYHIDIPRLQKGGINLQVFACCICVCLPEGNRFAMADSMIDCLSENISANSNKIAVCRTASEAKQIIASGKIAAFLAIENGMAIENKLENIEYFYNKGVRYLTLTHVTSLDWCRSSADNRDNPGGLTDFGREVIAEMNRLGMIIDVSHINEASFFDVLDTTKQPIIASHSCAYSITPHNRNLTDEQLRGLAANGGIIGINFCTDFLSSDYAKKAGPVYKKYLSDLREIDRHYSDQMSEDAYQEKFSFLTPFANDVAANVGDSIPSSATVVDHIDHIVKLVGPDHVALGSDFDGIFITPADLGDCSQMPNITREMVRRGYAEEDIKKILGGNFMRVFREVCG
ncbi:MAG: hypothetical protein DRP46_02195 [Candidatus Zixiibacteriota bacterium]|nr:MAG: hypothetical protein DRP46_02195 [candidate division Zixibacteria bacterium]